jgi:hypothetical protein
MTRGDEVFSFYAIDAATARSYAVAWCELRGWTIREECA